METTPKPAETPKPKSNMWKLIAIVVVVLVVVAVAAYIYFQKPAVNANVLIQDDGTCTNNDAACVFSPATYNVTVGSAVVWKNNGGVLHTVTSNATANGSGAPSFNSNVAQNGGTYSFTFSTAGTYKYYCNIHLWMKGIINAK